MPMTDASVARVYNAAYEEVMNLLSWQTPARSRVCHPIGQLLGNMVDNGRWNGILSSATRAYFLWIEEDGKQAEVHISSLFFVGVPNFSRALAFVHSLACQ